MKDHLLQDLASPLMFMKISEADLGGGGGGGGGGGLWGL